jgi:hypothetical protein
MMEHWLSTVDMEIINGNKPINGDLMVIVQSNEMAIYRRKAPLVISYFIRTYSTPSRSIDVSTISQSK